MRRATDAQVYRALASPADSMASSAAPPPPPPPSSRARKHQIGDVQELTWKERVQTFLDGKAGIALEMLNVLLSMILVVMSVVDSYEATGFTKDSHAYSQFELFCTFLFAVDFTALTGLLATVYYQGLHLFASDERLRFVVNPMGIIDLLTIIPPLITVSSKQVAFVAFRTRQDVTNTRYFLASLQLDILQLVRVARVFRMLAVLRLYRILQSYRGFDYELGVLAFMIFALIFVAAGVFQILEESYYTSIDSELQFHQAIYFVFVTVSTVGFGDITPKNTASQFFVMVMIIIVVTVIPRQINRLVELSKLQHGYMHSYNLRKRSSLNGGHVVVTGHVSFESVSEFLSEFYRTRQGRVNMDVVFLTDVVPTERLQGLLLNVKYRRRTTYLKGSLLNDKDAKRAHIDEAAAVFILAPKDNPKHADAADALTILQALAIDKFRFQNRIQSKASNSSRRQRDIRCFLQILSSQRTRGLRTITGVEVALNTPRLRTAILARSIVCPGATALLLNLIYSASEHDVEEAKTSNVPWVAEYARGLQHQLFPVFLPKFYDGLVYDDVAEMLYSNFFIIFVALYDKLGAEDKGKRIRLCPFDQHLRENDIGFFIAPSASFAKHAVEKLSSLKNLDYNQYGVASSRLPTLVFSSDNVLDRQSMVDGRSPSIDLVSDDDDEERVDKVEAGDLDKELLDTQAFYTPSATTSTYLAAGHQRARINSTESSSSCSSSSSSSTGSQLPMLPPFMRQQQVPVAQLRRTNSILAPKHLRKLQDHIIICGPFAHGHQIACYIEELYRKERANSNSRMPTVLLLVKRFPTDTDFDNLSAPLPHNVFVEKGVSQNVEDLLRVRAFEAKAVLMIPGHWKYHVDEFREESLEELSDHLIDYQVIMSTLSLQTVHDLHHEHLRSGHHQHSPTSLHNLKHQRTGGGLNGIEERANMLQKLTLGCSVVRSHDSIKYFAYKSSQSNHGHGLQRVSSINLKSKRSRFFLRASAKAAERDHDLSGREAEMLLPAAFAPSYAAGEIFVDSVLDTLLCQSFFNPYVIDLVHALAGDYYSSGGHHHHHHSSSSEGTFASSMMKYFSNPETTRTPPPGATNGQKLTGNAASKAALERHQSSSIGWCGDSFHTNHSDSVEVESDDDEQEGNAYEEQPPMGDFRHPVLSTATVARELEGNSFQSVFSRGLQQGVLVLGIYRRANDPRRGNTLPYVFTCPDGDAVHTIERGDWLHVLTKHHPPVCIQ